MISSASYKILVWSGLYKSLVHILRSSFHYLQTDSGAREAVQHFSFRILEGNVMGVLLILQPGEIILHILTFIRH